MIMKSLSRYPDGAAGIALVLLRLACAWIAFLMIPRLLPPAFSPNGAIVMAAALALALALGLATRIVAFVVAAATLASVFLIGGENALTLLARACACAALGLLGSGAYSIDANVFGRRVIRLEPRGPERPMV
jgi:putative oxidoreductase